MDRACKNCFHFASVENETRVGVCRLRPPIYDFDATPEGMVEADLLEVYTPVCINDVCGHFAKRKMTALETADAKFINQDDDVNISETDEVMELKNQIAELENGNRSLHRIIDAQREEIRTMETISEFLRKNAANLTATLEGHNNLPFKDAWKPAKMQVSDPLEEDD